MSILIKDMEMPTSCIKCKLCVAYKCVLTGEIRWSDEFDYDSKRFEDCPLIPVPPHYDLIDHNALKNAVMYYDAETRLDFLKHAMDCINKAPVVIPSDMPIYGAEEGE